jgi:hypothetical protein
MAISLKTPKRESKRSEYTEIDENISFINRISMRLANKNGSIKI